MRQARASKGRRLALLALALTGVAACSSSPDEVIGEDKSPDTGGDGYCRTTTCPPADGYPTADGLCEPPDYSSSETCRNAKASNAPIWWRTACVGYDLNQAASKYVPYAAFSQAAQGAFAAWTSAVCPSNSGGTASSRVSVDVRDLGPVSCDHWSYDSSGPNQSVIVFHDDVWPYEASDRTLQKSSYSLTVALTTVTFDPVSGEIYDADMELNSADYKFATPAPGTPAGGDAYDLQSVMTHEAGHFLGLAHSPLVDAVMYKAGDGDTGAARRDLRLEDVRGICAIYPPDGTRSVSTLVDASGRVSEGACDPTPRHGFSSTCN